MSLLSALGFKKKLKMKNEGGNRTLVPETLLLLLYLPLCSESDYRGAGLPGKLVAPGQAFSGRPRQGTARVTQ